MIATQSKFSLKTGPGATWNEFPKLEENKPGWHAGAEWGRDFGASGWDLQGV